jgi:hypothetical protein
MGKVDEPPRRAPVRPYDGPKAGRRVRILAQSDVLADPVWYTVIVVATRLNAFQMRMDGLPLAWFKTSDRWFYAEPLFTSPKTGRTELEHRPKPR